MARVKNVLANKTMTCFCCAVVNLMLLETDLFTVLVTDKYTQTLQSLFPFISRNQYNVTSAALLNFTTEHVEPQPLFIL